MVRIKISCPTLQKKNSVQPTLIAKLCNFSRTIWGILLGVLRCSLRCSDSSFWVQSPNSFGWHIVMLKGDKHIVNAIPAIHPGYARFCSECRAGDHHKIKENFYCMTMLAVELSNINDSSILVAPVQKTICGENLCASFLQVSMYVQKYLWKCIFFIFFNSVNTVLKEKPWSN